MGGLADAVQDAPLGQFINWVSKGRYFAFPEQDPNFKIPWEQANASEKEKEIEATLPNSQETSNATTPSHISREPSQTAVVNREDIEARPGLSTIPTSHSSARGDFGVVTTRTRTREQTTPYSRERFEVEQEEAIERKQSSIIAPQRTADGVILVDWYTTDDPANPQNWNSWKKVWVALVIFLYTFAVYSASAIYTSAEPQVMAKFGIGQAKASLGLSMYVIGYGVGPM
jgi:DHA1 family multidrug resistance protein-like MFS transporter